MDQRIAIPHGVIDGMQGQNYEIDGAISLALEVMGEPDFDYWMIAGLTGDSFTQIYYRDHWRGNSAAEVRLSDGDVSPVIETFALCGYDCEFVPARELLKHREAYMERLMRSIDRGVPVIRFFDGWQMVVGYEDNGKALLAIWGDRWGDTWTTPGRIEEDQIFALPSQQGVPNPCPNPGWFFPGQKRRPVDLAELYRKAIDRLPDLLTMRGDNYCFGSAAFRAWAQEIESGKYDSVEAADFEENNWYYYTNYVCVLASNGSCYRPFLEKALSLNPDMGYLIRMGELLGQLELFWGGDAPGKGSLEDIGGGFNITLETLQSPEKRALIAGKLRECAALADELLNLLNVR